MATSKTKEELVRLAWLAALRRQGERQCAGFSGNPAKACALQLLAEVAGIPAINLSGAVASTAGLSDEQGWRVIAMNDGRAYARAPHFRVSRKHTFAEIADVIAGWFAKGRSGAMTEPGDSPGTVALVNQS